MLSTVDTFRFKDINIKSQKIKESYTIHIAIIRKRAL